MADTQYKFDGMLPALRAEGTDNGQLIIGEYKGYISLTVFMNNTVAVKIPINRYAHFAVKQCFNAIQKAAPNTRLVALNTNEWDPQTRKQSFKNNILFGKTEDGQYYIEVKDRSSAPIKFMFKWPAMVTYGSDPIDDATKSLHAFLVWKEVWERDVPSMMFHSRLNWVPPQRNNARGGNSKPSNTSKSNSTSGSEDDEVY